MTCTELVGDVILILPVSAIRGSDITLTFFIIHNFSGVHNILCRIICYHFNFFQDSQILIVWEYTIFCVKTVSSHFELRGIAAILDLGAIFKYVINNYRSTAISNHSGSHFELLITAAIADYWRHLGLYRGSHFELVIIAPYWIIVAAILNNSTSHFELLIISETRASCIARRISNDLTQNILELAGLARQAWLATSDPNKLSFKLNIIGIHLYIYSCELIISSYIN